MNNLDLCLSSKSCTPCEGGEFALDPEIIFDLLSKLKGKWIINEAGHLYKEYVFRNFIEAMDFANKIAKIAEKEAHHPDLKIAWGKCAVSIWTHETNGLTKNDFILAAKISDI